MSDLPRRIRIHEEGPREGFQIESASIATADKIAFIEALSTTGVPQIDCVSYVDPRRVPGMADAEAVARGIHRTPGVRYTGLWLNVRGLERALALPLDLIGAIRVTASETFSMRNTGMNVEQTFAEQRRWLALYREHGIAVEWGYVMTAFGCNFEGEVPVAQVLRMVEGIFSVAAEAGVTLRGIYLADTVGRATPKSIEARVGALRERWPSTRIGLHLHDTRGTGLANAYAALRMGVDQFDATCGGLGGCPFAGHKGASGNICTEDLAYMCEEMGIETGVDLRAMVECARMAERIIGHPLPGKLMRTAL
ncbi:MAG: hydroxymethylglutaryl-CoA lyase [Burkholderiales bacterium]|nr:hydroxymethylglutaryl-CoA lyase [Burkholderiales bacterium]MCE7876918.1 hydroxymethylglutaryl-CoA lyase [Betaproteobacteria bacterium PRO3]